MISVIKKTEEGLNLAEVTMGKIKIEKAEAKLDSEDYINFFEDWYRVTYLMLRTVRKNLDLSNRIHWSIGFKLKKYIGIQENTAE